MVRTEQQGFTLLELMVALAILGLVLVALFRLTGTSLTGTESRERQLELASLAEAVLEAALVTGAQSPDELGLALPPTYRVTLERGDFGDAPLLTEETFGTSLIEELGLLKVRVEDAQGRQFSIATLDERPDR